MSFRWNNGCRMLQDVVDDQSLFLTNHTLKFRLQTETMILFYRFFKMFIIYLFNFFFICGHFLLILDELTPTSAAAAENVYKNKIK